MRNAGADDQRHDPVKGAAAGQIDQREALGLGLGAGFRAVIPAQGLGPARQQRPRRGKARPPQPQHRHAAPFKALNRNHPKPPSRFAQQDAAPRTAPQAAPQRPLFDADAP